MTNMVKLFLLGIMTWMVPFLSAFFFLDKSGTLSINIFLFKTIMILVGGMTGALAIIMYFKKLESAYFKQGFLTGIVWLFINIVMDLLVLIPMSKMSYPDYFMQIGLRYLMIPIMAILVGYLLEINRPNHYKINIKP
jgi:hypothetical protein